MEDLKEGFARRAKAAIEKSGKSMNKLSEESGINRNRFTKYVSTKTKEMPGSYNLALLCETLNVSADWLLFGSGDAPTTYERIEEADVTWDDNMASNAIEDFNNIKRDLPYALSSSIGTALRKLWLLERQGARVMGAE